MMTQAPRKRGRPRHVSVREIVARTFFSDKFRLRRFDDAKPWMLKEIWRKTDEALKRSGVDGEMKFPVKFEPLKTSRFV
jgi:hypothetical protein